MTGVVLNLRRNGFVFVKQENKMQVEDFTDLSKVSTEKLLKLRDVARDNYVDAEKAKSEAWKRLDDILEELEERKNVQKAV
ncbi:hypothetical protein GECvBMG_gp005 [Salmonella phage GEC_vB_MG]|nr:hypothetical protein GECvBMG_gp005 [Salmonella phage GEC_vB_MG]